MAHLFLIVLCLHVDLHHLQLNSLSSSKQHIMFLFSGYYHHTVYWFWVLHNGELISVYQKYCSYYYSPEFCEDVSAGPWGELQAGWTWEEESSERGWNGEIKRCEPSKKKLIDDLYFALFGMWVWFFSCLRNPFSHIWRSKILHGAWWLQNWDNFCSKYCIKITMQVNLQW